MVTGMDQGSISGRVGCDTHDSHETWLARRWKFCKIESKGDLVSALLKTFFLLGQAFFAAIQEKVTFFIFFFNNGTLSGKKYLKILKKNTGLKTY